MAISEITLKTPDGADFPLAQLKGRPVAVHLVRYFGCLPCQEYLQNFSARRSEFEAIGVNTLCVGGSADYQARWLIETGVETPLLLDPDHEFRTAVGMGNIGAGLLHPKGQVNYLKAIRNGRRPMKVTRDTIKSPGVVVLGPDLEVVWSYEGRMIGDYPPLDEFLAAARDRV